MDEAGGHIKLGELRGMTIEEWIIRTAAPSGIIWKAQRYQNGLPPPLFLRGMKEIPE
jgi:hypothetical protein